MHPQRTIRVITTTIGAIPLASRVRGDPNASEVEPFHFALGVVASYHLTSVIKLVADAVAPLINTHTSGSAFRQIGNLASANQISISWQFIARFRVGNDFNFQPARVALRRVPISSSADA